MKIEHLIFDLDNTLYPSTGAMDAGISSRIMQNVCSLFNVSLEEAKKLRQEQIGNFSTTLEWLCFNGLKNTDLYFSSVHPENEADELEADFRLRPMLETIKIPKIIFTNSTKEHAERVLKKLNILDLFDHICDIRECNLKGKPYESAFNTALKACGGTVYNTVFFDDLIKYTDGYKAMGGTAVLVGNKNGKPLNPEAKCSKYSTAERKGSTFKIDTIYELPEILKTLSDI